MGFIFLGVKLNCLYFLSNTVCAVHSRVFPWLILWINKLVSDPFHIHHFIWSFYSCFNFQECLSLLLSLEHLFLTSLCSIYNSFFYQPFLLDVNYFLSTPKLCNSYLSVHKNFCLNSLNIYLYAFAILLL